MSSSSPAIQARQVPPVHPAWCDPQRCDASGGRRDIHHRSLASTWHAERDDVELSLMRYQYGDDETTRGYLLTLRHLGVDEHATALLTDGDLIRLLHGRDRLVELTS